MAAWLSQIERLEPSQAFPYAGAMDSAIGSGVKGGKDGAWTGANDGDSGMTTAGALAMGMILLFWKSWGYCACAMNLDS